MSSERAGGAPSTMCALGTSMAGRFALALLIAAIFIVAIAAAPGAPGSREASAQEEPGPTTSVVTETTSTLPTGGEIGNIVPRPNSGREPETPGDPGGWQQLALFILVCVVIAAMGGFMWWRSRVARARRSAAGQDPVKVATEHGADVRAPRPPGIVD